MSLLGHKALVTGGSRGLGRAVAVALSELGCSVTILGRNETGLEQTMKKMSIIDGEQSHNYIKYDLANLFRSNNLHLTQNSGKSSESSPDLGASLLELNHAIKDISILINCAGVTNHKLLPRLSNEDIFATLNLNLTCPILLSKMAFKHLLQSKKRTPQFTPTIVNISSILALNNEVPGTSVYSASKAGLLGFTSSLASELKGKIRVNAILPGLIQETDMGANANIENPDTVSLNQVVTATVEVINNQQANGKFIEVSNSQKQPPRN